MKHLLKLAVFVLVFGFAGMAAADSCVFDCNEASPLQDCTVSGTVVVEVSIVGDTTCDSDPSVNCPIPTDGCARGDDVSSRGDVTVTCIDSMGCAARDILICYQWTDCEGDEADLVCERWNTGTISFLASANRVVPGVGGFHVHTSGLTRAADWQWQLGASDVTGTNCSTGSCADDCTNDCTANCDQRAIAVSCCVPLP